MRKLTVVAAVAAFVGSFGAASAADLSMKDYGPAPIWNGFYVGGHLGAVWNDSKTSSSQCDHGESVILKIVSVDDTPPPCYNWSDFSKVKVESQNDDVALIGGVQVGRNWQLGSRVIGFEGDISFANGLDYLGSLRGRVGYARDNLLLYLTGGVAFAGFQNHDTKVSFTDWAGDTYSNTLKGGGDDRRIGAVVGAGAEYKIRPNMSIGVEGLYYAFSDSEKTWEGSLGGYCGQWVDYKVTEKDDNDLFVVRGRLNYHFNDERDSPLK